MTSAVSSHLNLRSSRTDDSVVVLSLLTFVVIVVTCLALGTKQPSSYVWTNFENNVGWPSGVTFLTGLTTPCLTFAGLDAVLHLAEEVTEPARTVPRALMTTVTIAFTTGLVFSVAMAYVIVDLDHLLENL